MTKEEAARILDPSTTREALAEIECHGHEAVMKAVEDACMMAIEALRKVEELEAEIDVLNWTIEKLSKERPKGRWEVVMQGYYIGTIQCSVCGRRVNVDTPIETHKIIRKYPFCHCGADMRGEEE